MNVLQQYDWVISQQREEEKQGLDIRSEGRCLLALADALRKLAKAAITAVDNVDSMLIICSHERKIIDQYRTKKGKKS